MGLLLIQMLKRVGAQIFATVSTQAKADLAREAGADSVILYTQQDFQQEIQKVTEGQGLGIVFDAVGQTTFLKSIGCLGHRGHMVLYG